MKNKYFLSSTGFTSLKVALKQLEEWRRDGQLDDDCRVIVGKKIYIPVLTEKLELKEEK